MKQRICLLVCWFVLFVLTGCGATSPKPDTQTPPLPSTYRNDPTSTSERGADDGAWWMRYGSAELNRLVDRAIANNADLRIATLQLAQAKIRADQSRAGGLPTLTAPVRTVSQGSGGSSDTQQSSQVGLQGAFRLDIWGEQAAVTESADLQVWRAVYERENVQRNTIASLVSAYVSYLAVNDSITIAKENEALSKDILNTIERRFALGDATLSEVEQQKATLFTQQVVIPGLINQQAEIKNVISRMVGAVPSGLQLSDRGLDELLLPSTEVGIPSQLLLHRPDVRMVEAKMRSANANIEVARARLLPPVDLSASAGYSAMDIANLFQPQNLFYNTIASLALTIFDGGRREGDKAVAQAYYEEMVETYGQTVYQAVREVEGALSAQKAAYLRLTAQTASTRAALNIFKSATEAYMADALDLSSLLDTRRSYQRAQDETQRLRADLLRANVALAQALGAGAQLGDLAARDTLGADQSVFVIYGADDQLTLQAARTETPGGRWEIELSGTVHRTAVLHAWRDLQARFHQGMRGRGLRAVKQGSFEGGKAGRELWYRLFVVGFDSQIDVDGFCADLRRALQNCRVVSR